MDWLKGFLTGTIIFFFLWYLPTVYFSSNKLIPIKNKTEIELYCLQCNEKIRLMIYIEPNKKTESIELTKKHPIPIYNIHLKEK